jgi:hypothetical protein
VVPEQEQKTDTLDSRELNICSDQIESLLIDTGFAIIARPSRFFTMGRVFKTLWTEPAGGTMSSMDKRFYNEISYGELSFTKMRRFVVVRKRLHSCLCLAIYTYGGQGTAKNDVRPQDHAVVFVHGTEEPILLPEETSNKGAFPIIVEEQSENIDPMSRLDFSRVYTVEHNVKVLKIGRISPEHHERLERYFVDSLVPSKDSLDFDPDPADPQTELDRLDPSFKTRKPKFFNTGRVFSTLWTDETDSDPEVRSFVVVGEGAQACTCLWVRTFHAWGLRKPVVVMTEADLEEYGLVYNSKIPKLVNGIKKTPLRVELSTTLSTGEIREPTLLHYKKFFQVQHDAKAKDIGRLDSKSQKLLHEYSSEYTASEIPTSSNDASDLITYINDAMELASTVLQYIGDVKDFSEDCVKIREQISSTMGLLFTLANRIKKAEDEQGDDTTDRAWLAAFQPLSVSDGPIEQFKGALEHLSAALVPKDGAHKLGTPLKWDVGDEHIEAVSRSVTQQKSRFVLALQNDAEMKEYVMVD